MKRTGLRTALLGGTRTFACLALILAATGGVTQAGACPPYPKPTVPEIDPGSALSAFTLLSGGVLILTDRRRRLAK